MSGQPLTVDGANESSLHPEVLEAVRQVLQRRGLLAAFGITTREELEGFTSNLEITFLHFLMALVGSGDERLGQVGMAACRSLDIPIRDVGIWMLSRTKDWKEFVYLWSRVDDERFAQIVDLALATLALYMQTQQDFLEADVRHDLAPRVLATLEKSPEWRAVMG